MKDVQSQLELGLALLADFHRLDKAMNDMEFLSNGSPVVVNLEYKMLLANINAFEEAAKNYIISARNLPINSDLIYLESQQHEDEAEYEVLEPKAREFRSKGMAIGQMVEALDALLKGYTPKKSDKNCAFIYDPDNKKIIENKLGSNNSFRVKSREEKANTICRTAFRSDKKFNWILANDIEESRLKQLEKMYGSASEYEENNPYKWIKKSCDVLNKKAKKIFKIEYNLFETDPDHHSIRLNPMAKIKK